MAKKLNLGNRNLAIVEANGEAMLPAETEDLPEVVHVGGEILAEDEDIIHIYKTEGKLTQDKVHHVLKGVPIIPEAKGHPQKLKHPKGVDNSHLQNVLGGNRNLIIPFL